MTSLCKGGNEPPGSLKANLFINIIIIIIIISVYKIKLHVQSLYIQYNKQCFKIFILHLFKKDPMSKSNI